MNEKINKKLIGFLVDNIDDLLSWNDLEKILSIFDEIEMILPQINRKRMIDINFLIKKILHMLNIDFDIEISKSKKTISKYEDYWDKIQLLIGDKIHLIINR